MSSRDCDDGAGFEGGSIKNCEAFTGEDRKYLPKTTFSTQRTLFNGPDQIDLYYFGRGHTDGDTFVVFRAARTMHTGDMMARKGLPFIDAANTNGSATAPGATLQPVEWAHVESTGPRGHRIERGINKTGKTPLPAPAARRRCRARAAVDLFANSDADTCRGPRTALLARRPSRDLGL